ncbi:hypothetical protein [Microbacterium karelineae]|uniref:hypothetical protein n=1 Tax=Microbacterium karelineae TaxID=2654283 RepID=UPI0012E9D828|nr:hypothetical protein [Microbacterium karelineae]
MTTGPDTPNVPDPAAAPTIPGPVRTTAYVIGLVVGALATSTITTAGALASAGAIDGTTGLVASVIAGGIASVVGTIAGGLGVAYRPTRPTT